jgi:hypothetical protein
MKYRYTLKNNFCIYISDLKGVQYVCEWGIIYDGLLTIKKGYSWDGCTCAIDTDRTYSACLVHDFLCQFRPIVRAKRDAIFYKILRANKFELSKLYYYAVKFYGLFFFN